MSVFRESRHAALLHHRSTVRRISQVCHLLKPDQLDEAAIRCSTMYEKALAKALPCMELANSKNSDFSVFTKPLSQLEMSLDKASLTEVISKTISALQLESQRVPTSSESLLLNVVRPIKECVDAAQRWLETLPVRCEDFESLKKQVRIALYTQRELMCRFYARS